MKRSTAFLAVVLVVVVGASFLMGAGQPNYPAPAVDPNIPAVQTHSQGVEFGETSQLHMLPGSYVYDEGIRIVDNFLPSMGTGIMTSTTTAMSLTSYPGWLGYLTLTGTTGTTYSTAAVSISGLSLTLDNVESGADIRIFKGNIKSFTPSQGNLILESRFRVPTFTPGTNAAGGGVFIGFAGTVAVTSSGASPAWSTSATTYGPSQVLGFNVTSGASAPVLGYTSIVTTSATGTTQVISTIPLTSASVVRVRIDATQPSNVQMLARVDNSDWVRLGVVDATKFSSPMQPLISVSKTNDATAIVLRVRALYIQTTKDP